MKDAQAQALEAILKTLPQPAKPKFVTLDKAPSELLPGERADVSWISTEDMDRDQEVVVAKDMDDSHFKLNPIVTLQLSRPSQVTSPESQMIRKAPRIVPILRPPIGGGRLFALVQ